MDNVVSTKQLPKISPIAILYCFFLIAVISTNNSGNEVPIATMKKLMKYSGIWISSANLITELMINTEPTATPSREIATSRMREPFLLPVLELVVFSKSFFATLVVMMVVNNPRLIIKKNAFNLVNDPFQRL